MSDYHNPAVEMGVLGSMLLSERAAEEAVGRATPEDFYRPANATIFHAMSDLVRTGQPIDMVTLEDALERMGELENVGGVAYVGELDFASPSASSVGGYLRILLRDSNRRKVHESARTLAAMAKDDQEPEAMLAEIGRVTDRLATGGAKVPEVDLSKAIDRMLYGKSAKGWATGFPMIDHAICKRRGGLAASQYTLFSAPSGEGKSSAMLSILFPALERGERCVFGSFADLDEEEVMYRAVRYANPLGIGRPDDARDQYEKESVLDAAERVRSWPWGFYDASESDGANTIEAFRAWLSSWSERNGPPTRVALDYAQVIRTSDARYSGHPTTANQHISHLVRLMAGKYGASFMVGSQVTKKEDGSYQTKHATDWLDHAAMEIQVFRGAFKITKNRHGTDRCEVPTEWDRMRLVVRESAGEEE